MGTRVITFGTFDVFHIGHVNMLTRAHELGDHLTVGVSTDDLNFSKKGRYPIYREEHRIGIVSRLSCVDDVFLEHSLELKRDYLIEHRADILVMGDDWAGKFDEFRDVCEVIYLPRTRDISTTEIIANIRALDL
ncbi:adenylyltransferase/cytidyltransferase family protein [Demequina sp. SYSU T00039]|uniref:Adenylyltransferase/cytidyltransferase family protein n=1 Tax=Demequina lignilytica TaxID=3051663 RepID=A0AAW7M8F4_9MICO|nr:MULTISPECIES: adenylyltransferase/cytidyltransferase family protein [unclassified Demequina]MDN4477891.1 adenylyltransferase/cytidyltransferase family protein [Demequina sp. SYSU T00039-1]MDN4487800.1 adenylyltransferase/cytidyltransferase family protein [Demequina sp. SYSU T00039]MDN4490817.1 adenylyltransferase/cytidyltransferase family protein [Demequina sp. SYSU T00068]